MSQQTVKHEVENVSDVIREMIGKFRGGRKWTRGSFQTNAEDPSFCLLGACQSVLGDGDRAEGVKHPLYAPTKRLIAKVIAPKKAFSPYYAADTIIAFNDSKRTTFARVEAILAAALVKARKLAGVA